MSDVLNAYQRLIDTAGRGDTYTVDRVLYPPYPSFCQADTVFGTGFDIDRTIMLPDIVEGRTVEATTKLRVIKTAAGALYLRSWLVWTPSDGHEHKSFASYEIDHSAAEQLAASVTTLAETGPTEDDLSNMSLGEMVGEVFSALFSTMDSAMPYKAQWQQFIPGEDLDLDDESEYDFAELHYTYHEKVITDLGGTASPATCMLSYMEIGEVGPEEIVALAQFVADELELNALV